MTATNHSFFTGDTSKAKQAVHWIVGEARRLGVKSIVYPECGHATRTLLQYFESWYEEEISGIERISLGPLVAGFLGSGRIQMKRHAFDVPMTYHYPCNFDLNAGISEEPRSLINAVAADFRELTPNREMNWCCGGGGGLIAALEIQEVRTQGGHPKVEQVRQTGALQVVTACENCRTQLSELSEHYDLGVEIKGVADLVADALIL